MDKIIIAAVADNGCIGAGGDLLWHIPGELKRFKKITSGHAVVMGRKTFDSLSKSGMGLPNRCNIVLSRHFNLTTTKSDRAPVYVKDLDLAFKYAQKSNFEKCFIIGGADIYKAALPLVDTLMITLVRGSYDGDVFFSRMAHGR